MFSPKQSKASAIRSGIVKTVGPVSNSKPLSLIRPARPPGIASRSSTVTLRPAPARRIAAERPARPAPTITTLSVLPLTVLGAPGSHLVKLLMCYADLLVAKIASAVNAVFDSESNAGFSNDLRAVSRQLEILCSIKSWAPHLINIS